MLKIDLYSDKAKEIEILRNELYGNHFTDSERESFEAVLDSLVRNTGHESYSMCKKSCKNLLSYSCNQQVMAIISKITKLIGRHAEFKKCWQLALVDNPQFAKFNLKDDETTSLV
mgnify:CR=1 FL=1